MKRKIIALILSVITIVSVCSVFAMTAYATATYSSSTGYSETYKKTISSAGRNTEIGHLHKCFPNTRYSKATVYKTDSTINKMNLWVMNEDEAWMSEKYTAYPTNNTCTIYYNTGCTFVKNAWVYLWGEQANVASKKVNLKFYSY